MRKASVRIGVGTRLILDGEAACVVALEPSQSGIELTIRLGSSGQRAERIALRELLDSGRARLIDEVGDSEGPADPAGVVLAKLSEVELESVRFRAAHVREVLTGYRSGHADLSADGEPRPEFDPSIRPCARRR